MIGVALGERGPDLGLDLAIGLGDRVEAVADRLVAHRPRLVAASGSEPLERPVGGPTDELGDRWGLGGDDEVGHGTLRGIHIGPLRADPCEKGLPEGAPTTPRYARVTPILAAR